MSQRIRGVILDVDGTLINSNDAHARAWVEALAEAGIDAPFTDVRRLIGMGGDKLLPAIADLDDSSGLGKQVSERRAQIFKARYLPGLRAFPKTRELLLRLRGAGLALAVASSARKEELAPFLQIANVADLIEDATSASDAQNSKPDPDIVTAALDKLALGAPHVLMVGDTPYDIAAATQAGIGCIALRCGGRADRELAGALAIYDDPADLLEKFESSPLAAGR
jgi:HAD superfamily hydrolase (TIGR01509 family)